MNSAALAECRSALLAPNVRAFLRVLREGETSQSEDAYRTIVGGDIIRGELHDHPRRRVWIDSLKVHSTAAGAYQFLARTWDECFDALGLDDFGPDSQDLAAVYLIRRRGALQDVLEGRLDAAVAKCAPEWASLPGSQYGQPRMSVDRVRSTWERYGGRYAHQIAPGSQSEPPAAPTPAPAPPRAPAPSYGDDWQPGPQINGGAAEPAAGATVPGLPAAGGAPTKQEHAVVAPIIAAGATSVFGRAALDAIVAAIPALARKFSSGSAVAERNVQAAEIILGTVKEAVGATNEQQVVERLADPAARQAAADAVERNWFRIESGGSGAGDTRRFLLEASAAGHGPVVWSTVRLVTIFVLCLLALANAIAAGVWVTAALRDVGVEAATQILVQVLQADIGAALMAASFWLGSSFGSRMKDEDRADARNKP